jgi:hypothetical protein
MATEFTAEFLERRMAEHRRWQHETEYRLIQEIMDEVQALPKRRPRTMTFDFDSALKNEPNYRYRKERAHVHPVNA